MGNKNVKETDNNKQTKPADNTNNKSKKPPLTKEEQLKKSIEKTIELEKKVNEEKDNEKRELSELIEKIDKLLSYPNLNQSNNDSLKTNKDKLSEARDTGKGFTKREKRNVKKLLSDINMTIENELMDENDDSFSNDKIEQTYNKKILLSNLEDFPNHPFKPYKDDDERLKVLIESIKKHGIYQPIIVRTLDNEKYQILSGHNRRNAARVVGLIEISAIVYTELTEEEAIFIVNETNIQQRSFKTWLPSEKADSIYQYHEAKKTQGNRTDLKIKTFGDFPQRSENYARKKTADVYGIGEDSIRLYLKLYNLSPSLKDRLDEREFGTTPAEQIAFIPEVGQNLINSILEEEDGKDKDKKLYGITTDNANKLRHLLEKLTEFDESTKNNVRKLMKKEQINPDDKSINKVKSINIGSDIYNLYFTPNQKSEDVEKEIIEALKYYKNRNTVESK